jgi:hypothetical protein
MVAKGCKKVIYVAKRVICVTAVDSTGYRLLTLAPTSVLSAWTSSPTTHQRVRLDVVDANVTENTDMDVDADVDEVMDWQLTQADLEGERSASERTASRMCSTS